MTVIRILTFSLIATIEVKTNAIVLFLPMFVERKPYPNSTAFQSKRREATVIGKCLFSIVQCNNP